MKPLTKASAWRGLWVALILALAAPIAQAQEQVDEAELQGTLARAETMGIRIMGFTEHDQPPRVAPAHFPVPDDPHQVFFLQRSMNSNTVVYTARFDAQGNLDRRQPLDIYWRRYNDQGERRELNRIERLFAFGVSVRRTREPGVFRINFRAVPQFNMTLRQEGPFRAALYGSHEMYSGRLVNIYLELADSRFIPQIDHVRLVVLDPETSRYKDVHIVPLD